MNSMHTATYKKVDNSIQVFSYQFVHGRALEKQGNVILKAKLRRVPSLICQWISIICKHNARWHRASLLKASAFCFS
jgi:hypothetical protein